MKYLIGSILLLCIAYGGGDILPQKEEIKDTLVVHDMVLQGKVINLGKEQLLFKLRYSDGINYIAYKDIESITTKYNYHISFKGIDIEGRVIGIEDNAYLKVKEGEDLRTIKISDIDNFVMALSDDASIENRVKNLFPFMQGNINLGFEIENSGNQSNELDLLLNLMHKRDQHEFKFYLDYQLDTANTVDTEKVVNKDELVGMLYYKYNIISQNAFYYGQFSADYDKPRHIVNRWIPTAGYGYRFSLDKSRWIEPSGGLAYVATTYSDTIIDSKDFTAMSLNLKGEYKIEEVPYVNNILVNGFVMYYPSIDSEFANDWVLRSNLTLSLPVFEFFSIKLAFDLRNDSNPDPSVGNNKTTSRMLFGVNF